MIAYTEQSNKSYREVLQFFSLCHTVWDVFQLLAGMAFHFKEIYKAQTPDCG
jgi:hypothetical protein